jgi:hypothetical protein
MPAVSRLIVRLMLIIETRTDARRVVIEIHCPLLLLLLEVPIDVHLLVCAGANQLPLLSLL